MPGAAAPAGRAPCDMLMKNTLEILRFAQRSARSAERINLLATELECRAEALGTLLITARSAGEGATHIAVNLLRTFAELHRRVMLVDADLRASRLAEAPERGAAETPPGLLQALSGECAPDEIVYPTDLENAWFVPAGGRTRQPLPLLREDRTGELLRELKNRFDLVLIDAPPAGEYADALELARHADGALLVVGEGVGRRRDIAEVAAAIERRGCPVIGAALNEGGSGRRT